MKQGFTLTLALVCLAGCGDAPSGVSGTGAASVTTPPDTSSPAVSQNGSASEADIAAVLEVNERIFEEYGRIAEVMTETSDILMRFNHFTDGHTERVLLCPECYPPPEDLNADVEDPEEVIPPTMEQLLKDAREFHMSALRFRNHLGGQKTTLELHLEKLRAGKLDSPGE